MATAAVGLVALATQQQAPPPTAQATSAGPDALRCKRRISFAYAHAHQPASVARRNARERNRVKQVNNGFATLRQHIPAAVAAALGPPPPPPAAATSAASPRHHAAAASRKLSKVETLRMAVEYIRGLQRLLEEHSASQQQATTTAATTVTVTSPQQAEADHGYCSASPGGGGGGLHCRRGQPPSPAPSFASSGSASGSGMCAADNCENYEPMSPEDEELLDVISWWQQSQ